MIFKWLNGKMDSVMHRRAAALAELIAPLLPNEGSVIDIGSGTGHNAHALRSSATQTSPPEITQVDVVDMSTVGESPVVFSGQELPFDDDCFRTGLMIHMLHYPADPVELMKEARRVIDGQLIVIQSTYLSRSSQVLLHVREFVWGRLAFWVSRLTGFVGKVDCALAPKNFLHHNRLLEIVESSGWQVTQTIGRPWGKTGIHRDVLVLNKSSLSESEKES